MACPIAWTEKLPDSIFATCNGYSVTLTATSVPISSYRFLRPRVFLDT